MTTPFSPEEIAIMGMYRTDCKEHLLADLTAAAPHVEDPDAAACVSSILGKLADISDREFEKISFASELL